jgi:hypothetical protein
MKAIRLTLLFALAVLTLSSCGWFGPVVPTSSKKFHYNLHLSFKDKDGNELIAPLAEEKFISDQSNVWKGEINPEKYKLDFLPAVPSADTSLMTLTASKYDDQLCLEPAREDGTFGPEGTWYLNLRGIMINNTDTPQDHLKYKFTCKMIFQDASVHEITAYWTKGEQADYVNYFPVCTKVVVDGKEYTPARGVTQNSMGMYIGYFATIVVNRE